MADEKTDDVVIDIIDELNLDAGTVSEKVAHDLLNAAEAIIRSSVSAKTPLDEFRKNVLFNRAAKSLAISMFYDRELSNGLGKGVQMIINNLKGRVWDGSA